MILEIVTPEAILFNGKVESVSVPGINGEFQMLDNHAPIVSLLKEGNVKIKGSLNIDNAFKNKFSKSDGMTLLPITSGTIELKENKVIILAD